MSRRTALWHAVGMCATALRAWSLAVERTRAAVNLVMQDVEAELGRGAAIVVVGTPDELRQSLVTLRPGWRTVIEGAVGDVTGWFLGSDGCSGIGLGCWEYLDWEDVVVGVADVIQEGIIEGSKHWGAAFPLCREHRTHPMEAHVVSDRASWTCPKGGVGPIPIGTLALQAK